MKISFPPSPSSVPEELCKIPSSYRAQTTKVLLTIFLFVVVYLTLLIGATALVYYGVFAGFFIISAGKNVLAILFGCGIIFLSTMIFFFLIKFIFAQFKDNDPARIVIEEKDQPDLFAFVRKVCEETKAPFPKKITFSPRINACVYYNSSFWSLFFPVRKNLEIGWPLMQSLNTEEFKAVLAHEFGHFSQSTTRLGSYIYTANRVIYNLAYSRDRWDDILIQLARVGYVFTFFANCTYWLATGVRHIMHFMYKLLNKSYMALSREMEFHADSMAVSVTGNLPICNALLKIEFFDSVFQTTLDRVEQNFKVNNKLPDNVFGLYDSFSAITAKAIGLGNDDAGLPLITEEKLNITAPVKRIKIKNLWASHPSFEERKKSAYRFPIANAGSHEKASLLLNDRGKWERDLTKKLVQPKSIPMMIDASLVNQEILEIEEHHSGHPRYNGFYTKRFIHGFNPQELIDDPKIQLVETEQELFSGEVQQVISRLRGIDEDLMIVSKIAAKQTNITSFEFDGHICNQNDAGNINIELSKEGKTLSDVLISNEKKIFLFYYQHAGTLQMEYFMAFATMNNLDSIHKKMLASFANIHPIMDNLQRGIRLSEAGAVDLTKRIRIFVGNFREALSFADQKENKKQYGTISIENKLSEFLCPEPVADPPFNNFNMNYFSEFFKAHLFSLQKLEMLIEQQQSVILHLQNKISDISSNKYH